MDGLGIGRAALVGNSFGGAVALRVAALHPERVSALLLFSAAAAPEPDPSPELLAVWEAEEGALEEGDIEKAVEAVVSAWVRPQAPDEVRGRIAAMQRRNYELHTSKTTLIPGCGHLAPLEAPEEFRRLVLANLD